MADQWRAFGRKTNIANQDVGVVVELQLTRTLLLREQDVDEMKEIFGGHESGAEDLPIFVSSFFVELRTAEGASTYLPKLETDWQPCVITSKRLQTFAAFLEKYEEEPFMTIEGRPETGMKAKMVIGGRDYAFPLKSSEQIKKNVIPALREFQTLLNLGGIIKIGRWIGWAIDQIGRTQIAYEVYEAAKRAAEKLAAREEYDRNRADVEKAHRSDRETFLLGNDRELDRISRTC